MLEPMASFFDSRLEGYEEHQLTCIESAQAFYPFTAELLPAFPRARVLDLGCGTGLELSYYFDRNPAASVTGIDLAPGMLAALRRKFPDKDITLLQGSYFDMPFPEDPFDAALSVESLHHFTQAEKIPLYRRIFNALKPGGSFILTDYFAADEAQERHHRQELLRLRAEQHLPADAFYHYDTPLTVQHEMEALQAAGFPRVEELASWGATHTLRATREAMPIMIETERLQLRELTQADFPALCAILQDPEAMVAYNGPFSDEEARQWLERQLARYEAYRHRHGLWAVILRATGEMIGQCGLTLQPWKDQELLEIGYLFQKAHWHQGYATEAAQACKAYAFNTLGAEEVCSIIRDTNLPSQGVARRCGMSPADTWVKRYRGEDMPHILFTVRRDPQL